MLKILMGPNVKILMGQSFGAWTHGHGPMALGAWAAAARPPGRRRRWPATSQPIPNTGSQKRGNRGHRGILMQFDNFQFICKSSRELLNRLNILPPSALRFTTMENLILLQFFLIFVVDVFVLFQPWPYLDQTPTVHHNKDMMFWIWGDFHD